MNVLLRCLPPLSRYLSRLLFATLCMAAVLSIGCSRDPLPGTPGRVILIGIDGASPRVVNQMVAAGRLPNLAKIAERGVHGPLRSEIPLHSPRIWNTIATGKTPEKHRIVSFSRKGRDGRHRLYASTDRRAQTLWSIASLAGMKVAW